MNLVWATRGRSWGFRFLLDGGFADPLLPYDRVFAGLEGNPEVFRRVGRNVAVRFVDPLGRCDEVGRPIPHDFVLLPPLAGQVHSIDEGRQLVWPLVASVFAHVWDLPQPPSQAIIQRHLREDTARDLGRGPR